MQQVRQLKAKLKAPPKFRASNSTTAFAAELREVMSHRVIDA
jgi:hypothetical protein